MSVLNQEIPVSRDQNPKFELGERLQGCVPVSWLHLEVLFATVHYELCFVMSPWGQLATFYQLKVDKVVFKRISMGKGSLH